MKKMIILLAVLLCTFSLSAQLQELTIMTEDWPPFNYEEDGVLKGISVDIVKEIMRRMDLDYEILVFPWARAYDYIQHKDNHVLFSMAYSEERALLFKWVGPIAEFKIAFYARPGFEVEINSLDDAKKVDVIGVPRDSLPNVLLENMGFENLKPLNDAESMIQMLHSGRIDLMCGANLAFQNLPEDLEYSLEDFDEVLIFRQTYLNIAFSLNVLDSTIEKWQNVLHEMVEDGTVDAIKAKY